MTQHPTHDYALLTEAQWHRFRLREWGLPTGVFPGRAWRTTVGSRPVVMLFMPIECSDHLLVRTLRVLFQPEPVPRPFPHDVRRAMAQWASRELTGDLIPFRPPIGPWVDSLTMELIAAVLEGEPQASHLGRPAGPTPWNPNCRCVLELRCP